MAGHTPKFTYYREDEVAPAEIKPKREYGQETIGRYSLFEDGEICLTRIPGVTPVNIEGELYYIVEEAGCYSVTQDDIQYPASVKFNGKFPESFKVHYNGYVEG